MSAPWLEWHDGPTPQRVSLERPITIGRTPENTIQVDSPAVSRTHCTVSAGPDGDILVDARQSANGVRVNGTRVPEARLRAGQPFEVGGVRFTVGGAVPAAVPTPGAAPALAWHDGHSHRSLPVAGTVTIGRTPENTIQVNAPGVSRRHATVTPAGSGVAVDATGSANGIRVNGTRVASANVPAGQAFEVGPVRFGVGAGAGSAPDGGQNRRRNALLAIGGVAAGLLLVGVVVAAVLLDSDSTGRGAILASQHINAAEGGTVRVEGGPTVHFESGALSDDAEVTIRAGEHSDSGTQAGVNGGPSFEIALSKGRLVGPALVELPIPDGLEDDDLRAAWYDDESEAWIAMPAEVDRERRVATYTTDHFSEHRVQANVSAALLFPYAGAEGEYTGGPQGTDGLPDWSNPYERLLVGNASGIDFGGDFQVLNVAYGVFKGCWRADGAGPDAGTWILVEHVDGTQTGYWHLSDNCAGVGPLMSLLEQYPGGVRIPAGFPLGTAGSTDGQAADHLHLERRQAMQTACAPKNGACSAAGRPGSGTPISWHGNKIEGWTFWMHLLADSNNTGFSYQGSATRGSSKAGHELVLCVPAKPSGCVSRPHAKAVVSRNFEGSTEKNDPDTQDDRVDFASDPGQRALPSTNVRFDCAQNKSLLICGGSEEYRPGTPPKPEPPSGPGGDWVDVPGNGQAVSGSFMAIALPRPSSSSGAKVAKVNFTMWARTAADPNGTWSIVCSQTKPHAGDVYACTYDLTNVEGDFRVSFDVYDDAGLHTLAPGGVRNLKKNGASEPGRPRPPSSASIKAVDSRTVEVSWGPSPSTATAYRVYGTGGTLLIEVSAGFEGPVRINGFEPGAEVCVNVRAVNADLESENRYAGCTTLPKEPLVLPFGAPFTLEQALALIQSLQSAIDREDWDAVRKLFNTNARAGEVTVAFGPWGGVGTSAYVPLTDANLKSLFKHQGIRLSAIGTRHDSPQCPTCEPAYGLMLTGVRGVPIQLYGGFGSYTQQILSFEPLEGDQLLLVFWADSARPFNGQFYGIARQDHLQTLLALP